MSIMEQMMGAMMGRMSKEDKEAMMDSMMEKFFADITPEEKQKMMADMMPKMMEGMDMSQMMPRMMMGMMSGGENEGSSGMQGMMGNFMQGQSGAGMSDMMSQMMPNCIRMMMPKMNVEKRGETAAAILSAIIDAGTDGMTEEQRKMFSEKLDSVVKSKV